MSHKDSTREYLKFKRDVEALLYLVDPYGMGSSVGSPIDEYSEEATRLIPALLRAVRTNSPDEIMEIVPGADQDLRDELLKRARQFAAQLAAHDHQ